jgi:hypothetical protein
MPLRAIAGLAQVQEGPPGGGRGLGLGAAMTDLLLQPMVIVDGQIVGGIAVFCALQNYTTPWLW